MRTAKIGPDLRLLLLNWTANKESLRWVGRFSFRAGLWFPQWFCLCKVSETNVKLSDSTFLLFSPSECNDSVCFSFLFPFFFFFFVEDQIASFQLKQIVVFLNWVFRGVYLFHCVIATDFDYGITTGSDYCMQLIDWTWKMNYDRKKYSHSVSCRHFQTIFFGLPLENRV